ncbi:MAG TPA: zf-TFIIB domain-containing protein [Kofleriaceae bacterium]|nr:zf-TFIIB domain-containing protein [Kofleriaceae bacterium]
MRCPRDQSALHAVGKRLTCTTCHGVFVEREDLAELVRMMAPDLHVDIHVPMQARSTEQAALACPMCTHAMQPVHLGVMPVDHCTMHGVWFDGGELQHVLRTLGEGYADREETRNFSPPGGRRELQPAQWAGEETLGQTLERVITWIFRLRR